MFKFLLVFILVTTSFESHSDFLPRDQEDLISKTAPANSEMTKAKFDKALSWVKKTYNPIFKSKGLIFQIVPDWNSKTVNAYAQRIGSTARISMFGGLARRVNFMGFLIVACHEVGHHLGGAPKYPHWASSEGQSDYFSTSKCMKLVLAKNMRKNIKPLRSSNTELSFAYSKCNEVYRGKRNKRKRAMCTRMASGALSTATLLNRGVVPKFSKPDTSIVIETYLKHPRGQCRLDTYFHGALCTISPRLDFDETNPRINACNRVDGLKSGVRPLCWYRP